MRLHQPQRTTITDDLGDTLHGTSCGRLRPLCSRQRIFSTSAFTSAFSVLEFSLVYGSGNPTNHDWIYSAQRSR
jgi:hypothetical protein